MTQVLINSISGACLSLLVALSFWLTYVPTKTFYFSHGAAITFGAYGCYWLSRNAGLPVAVAALVSAVVSALLFRLVDTLVFMRIRRDLKTWMGLVASIGVYVILQSIVSLSFGDETLVLRSKPVEAGHVVWGGRITNPQIILIVISVILFLGVATLLQGTRLGREIRGVSSNADLSVVLGINAERVTGWAVGIGCGLAAIAGILNGFDADITPGMGFRLLLNGVVVMIVAGVGNIVGFCGAAFLVAISQHCAAYYFNARWMDAVAFLILIAFLIWKPLGFSGRRLRKVEV